MATQVQFRRGNTTQTSTFTGAVAEITVDTDKKTVVVHDGVTAGGFALALESAQQDAQAFAKANAAFSQANGAFDKANTNATNITSIEGVNNTQNTNITSAQNTGTSAFAQANGAFDKANTNASDITTIQGVNNTQNTNITNAQNSASAAFIRANNSLNANAGGVITGPVTVAANLTVTGNLTIVGNTVTQDIATLNIGDPLIYLAANNYTGDAVEIGFAANYYDGATQRHTGVFREASNKEFYVFDNYTPEPEANLIDINDASFRIATLNANLKSQSITLNSQNLQTYINGAYNNANAAFNSANNIDGINVTQNTNITNAQNSASSAFNHANAAFNAANTGGSTADTYARNHANAAFSLANGTATVANTDFTNITTTAGTYGNSTHYGVVTVAANGRVTSVQTFVAQDPSALAFAIALG